MKTFYLAMSFIALTTMLCCGCSGKKEWPKAHVSGRVAFQGKPLDHGRVVFVHEQGHGGAGEIKPDGRYSLDGIIGSNRVMIECFDPNRTTADPGRPDMQIPVSLIPTRYNNHMSSGLSAEVSEGENTADFDLKP